MHKHCFNVPARALLKAGLLLGAAEYIQDTEEYINIELDSSRNRLIRLELLINTATFSIAMYSLVAGEQF